LSALPETSSVDLAPVPRRSPLRGRARNFVFLGYHSVTEDGPPYLSLKPATFERQLDLLVRAGFRSGTRAALERIAAGERPRGRHAFLTFDDGFADTVTAALPPMSERALTGMVFVLPRHLDSGAPLDWPAVAGEARRRPQLMRSMDWTALEQLVEAGWEVGSHTVSHPRLPELSDEQLLEELLDSRRAVEARLGSCEMLAYPFGDWDDRVAAAAVAAGYSFAFTLPFGAQVGATRMSIPRVTIDDRDTALRFRMKLSGTGRSVLFSSLRPAVRRALRKQPHSHAE
jgi:peptidoglycan/xylan/chitin deacetylase (PgdA/CDA1 family)